MQLWDFSDGASPAENFKQLSKLAYFKDGYVRALGVIKDAEQNRDVEEKSVRR